MTYICIALYVVAAACALDLCLFEILNPKFTRAMILFARWPSILIGFTACLLASIIHFHLED